MGKQVKEKSLIDLKYKWNGNTCKFNADGNILGKEFHKEVETQKLQVGYKGILKSMAEVFQNIRSLNNLNSTEIHIKDNTKLAIENLGRFQEEIEAEYKLKFVFE